MFFRRPKRTRLVIVGVVVFVAVTIAATFVEPQTVCRKHGDCPLDRYCVKSGVWCEECKDCVLFKNTIDYAPIDDICPFTCNTNQDCVQRGKDESMFCTTPPSPVEMGSSCWDCRRMAGEGIFRPPTSTMTGLSSQPLPDDNPRNVDYDSTNTTNATVPGFQSCPSDDTPCLCRSSVDCPDDHFCASEVEIEHLVYDSSATGTRVTSSKYTVQVMDESVAFVLHVPRDCARIAK